jgi:hypothetical protein
MRRLALVVCALLAGACGSSSSGDDDGNGDAGIDPGGDGGVSQPKSVKVTLTNRPTNAAQYSFFVAYQDGSAPWAVAPAPSGDVYTLSISAPSWGVAYGCIGNVIGTTTTQLRTITSAHFAISERTDVTLDVPARCTDRNAMNVTLSGTITNRPTTGVLAVWYGGRSVLASTSSGNFTLQTPPGTHDLVVTHAVPEGNGEYYVDEAFVIRDVMISGPTTRTIDFANAQATDYYPVTVSSPNLQARILATTTLTTANGTGAGLVRESMNCETQGLAASQMRSSDVYDQLISVTLPGSSATVTNATNAPAAQTYVPPVPLGAIETHIAGKDPYPMLETSWGAYADTVGYVWNATQTLTQNDCGGNLACTIVWASVLSPGVTGSEPAFRMPDLASVMGWKSQFAFVGSTQIVGGVTAQTSSAGAGDFPPGIAANGTKRAFVRTDYGVTP